jgi:hypothetical protein
MEDGATMSPDQDESKETQMLLEGLRRALDGQPRLLQGKDEKGALFPGGKPGAGPVKVALDNGYLIVTDPPVGVKATKAQKYARLTDKGRQFLIDFDTPKRSLEALVPVIRQTAERVDEIAVELRGLITAQLRGVMEVLKDTMEFIQEVLRPREDGAEGGPAVEASVHGAAGEEAPPPLTFDNIVRAAYDKLSMHNDSEAAALPLVALYDEVHETLSELSVAEFHDRIKRMWADEQVELHPLEGDAEEPESEKVISHEDRVYDALTWKG